MILCFIPWHEAKRDILPHLMDWVRDAELPDTEVVMRWHRGPYGEKDAVKIQREFGRTLALEKGATHLFFVGADTIPPLDALPKLLALQRPLVSGTYYGRSKGSGRVPGMDCALIAREVLEKLSWLSWEGPDDDYPFYDRAKELGYDVYYDSNVICRHYADGQTFF